MEWKGARLREEEGLKVCIGGRKAGCFTRIFLVHREWEQRVSRDHKRYYAIGLVMGLQDWMWIRG